MRLLVRTAAPAKAKHSDSPITRMRRPEWVGQTLASICWALSLFFYGVNSAGDWLQLAAASSWLTANLLTLRCTKKAN